VADNGACRFPYWDESVPGQAHRWFSLISIEETSQPLGFFFCRIFSDTRPGHGFWIALLYLFFVFCARGNERVKIGHRSFLSFLKTFRIDKMVWALGNIR